ncbi:MAG TPA: DUF418 domain-containing protein [Caldimonas sp.]|nr:DUF418 domain-containing protein [Caldimonas sp.]
MSADADSTADDAEAPLAATDRIAALDVLRGFALLGIFIMNMPGFSHSMFAAPAPPRTSLDALVAALRETFFAGKFNLLFGLVFGIGFALQMARLNEGESTRAARLGAAPRPHRATQVYARRLAFLFVVGLVHAMLLWSGDVLLIYAVLGFALLFARRLGDRALLALIAACLVFPALAEVARSMLFGAGWDTVAAFQYQQFEASNDLAYGHGSFLDAMRETTRIFDWSWRSPFGLFVWASFFVQMATGILIGYVLGRRGWPVRPLAGAASARSAPWTALLVAIAFGVIESAAFLFVGGSAGVFVSTLARTIARASLAAFYALTVVRFVRDRADLPRWLYPLRDAGRMPLSNYLLQTLLASVVFYGWGLGLWGSAGPALEAALALALFVFVQLPLSSFWMARFRHGPIETIWRRFTYGR